LRHIFGFRRIAEHSSREGQHPRQLARHQGLHRSRIAASNPKDQVSVRIRQAIGQ
jgi:hypothetical protein